MELFLDVTVKRTDDDDESPIVVRGTTLFPVRIPDILNAYGQMFSEYSTDVVLSRRVRLWVSRVDPTGNPLIAVSLAKHEKEHVIRDVSILNLVAVAMVFGPLSGDDDKYAPFLPFSEHIYAEINDDTMCITSECHPEVRKAFLEEASNAHDKRINWNQHQELENTQRANVLIECLERCTSEMTGRHSFINMRIMECLHHHLLVIRNLLYNFLDIESVLTFTNANVPEPLGNVLGNSDQLSSGWNNMPNVPLSDDSNDGDNLAFEMLTNGFDEVDLDVLEKPRDNSEAEKSAPRLPEVSILSKPRLRILYKKRMIHRSNAATVIAILYNGFENPEARLWSNPHLGIRRAFGTWLFLHPKNHPQSRQP